jgi:predicted acyltransferase
MSRTAIEEPTRLLSIDQLRGYAIFGMILVNAKGMFGVKVNQLSHHQDSFTYADTIAPIFMFVVGISMRLSWLRRSNMAGAAATRSAMVKRFTILVLIACAIYMGWLWDALMDIGLAGLLAVMFIDKSPKVRAVAGCCMALLYQALVSFTVYGPWIMRTGKLTDENMPYLFKWIPYQSTLFDVALNGGPFGPLSWCFILLFGTVAYDLLQSHDRRRIVTSCLSLGFGLCAAGWVVSIPWGETKALWPISAYHMTLPFPLWSTGICFLTLLAFYLLCDVGRIRIPTFNSVSMNALFIYIVQCVISETEAPKDIITACYGWIQRPLAESAPAFATPIGICGILLYYGLLAGLAYVLHRKKIYIRI